MNLTWNKQLDDDESLQIRFSENYYLQTDRANRNTVRTREEMIEVQHNFIYDDIHNIVWGGDFTLDNVHIGTKSGTPQQSPHITYDSQVSGYIQDEITLRDDLWLTIGYRGHHNERSFYDWAGIVALVHEIAPKHFLRAAVSRSFRKPIFWEENANTNAATGNKSLKNEELLAYELGYRGQLRDNLELNVESFINKHKDLIGNVGSSNPKPYQNCLDMTTYGLETAIDWRPCDWWLVRGFHVYEHQTDDNRIRANTSNLKVASVPSNKAGLTNRFYIDDTTTLNTQLFWSETCANKSSTKVPAYTRFDIRLAKRFWNDNAELAFGVSNLQEHMHYEGGTASTSEVPRIAYVQFYYTF